MTVTPYERSVWVTIIHVGLEVRQELVVTVLGRFGAVKAAKMCSYAQAPGVLNGHRQVRIDLKQDIPSFLFIAGHKAHVRYPGQPRTCFRCGEPGTKPRAAQTRNVGAAFVLGMIAPLAQRGCVLTMWEGGTCLSSLSLLYVSRTKSGDPNPVPAPRKSPPASPINSSSSVPSPPPVSPDPEALSDGESVVIDSPEVLSDSDSGESVISEPKRATGTSCLTVGILGEAEFRQGFETRYKGWQTLKPAFASTSQWWDDIKLRIKRYAIQYCVSRARASKRKILQAVRGGEVWRPFAVIALQTYLDEKYHGARVRAVTKRWKPRSALH
ncbi:putative zinc finger CCHC domain-containing protein 3-like [Apostichopus japonicus]|uniref:Putative zinc finger CCHC domain-containing protein 3-like n=1 Tax=Stichopus japonicus TaxID=307972 RepID=A0A2G8KYF2_STIJA|nr:putative zinc finger CCHC domain-containing protein 3-like [Apostichopus japonicus]